VVVIVVPGCGPRDAGNTRRVAVTVVRIGPVVHAGLVVGVAGVVAVVTHIVVFGGVCRSGDAQCRRRGERAG
jgi:hypothetical protein